MSRGISAALKAALAAAEVRLFALVKAEFDSGAVRLWTGLGDLVWSGETYTGAGGLLEIGLPGETAEIRAAGGTLTLNGLDPSILAIADTENYQGRRVTIWIGAFDAAGAPVVDPDLACRGTMDTMEPVDEGAAARVVVNIENRLVSLDRARERRLTPEDLALDYPGDKGFDFVAALQDQTVTWGG